MSWSPQHCARVRNPKAARDRFQCAGESGRFGWVLHGLWPEADGPAYPQWCRPAKIVPAPVLRRHMCMTPSAQLLQHEWAKHGTCMSPHPAAYFRAAEIRSEEHTSELQSLMRISYAVFCLKKKKTHKNENNNNINDQ